MLKNITNHASDVWTETQLAAANESFGGVVDLGFPNVSPIASTEEIIAMADAIVDELEECDNVLVQGEMSLTFQITTKALAKGCTVWVACSNRDVVETILPNGNTVKKSVFAFVQFRAVS